MWTLLMAAIGIAFICLADTGVAFLCIELMICTIKNNDTNILYRIWIFAMLTLGFGAILTLDCYLFSALIDILNEILQYIIT